MTILPKSPTSNPAGSPKLSLASPTVAAQNSDEFARFEDLTRKLTHVPKAELDEKRKKA